MSPYLTPAPRARVARALLLALPIAVMLADDSVSSDQASAAPACRPEGAIVRVPGLVEGSGVAVSRSDPRRAWAHNDSGKPVLFSLDDRGVVTGPLDSGAGLGLALVRWIARVHGGDVALTRSSATGSTFTVLLPRLG